MSVILLHVLFAEPVRPIAIVGLVLILFSNLTLHASQRSTNALSLTLIATVYVALASQILPTGTIGSSTRVAAALTGLFARSWPASTWLARPVAAPRRSMRGRCSSAA